MTRRILASLLLCGLLSACNATQVVQVTGGRVGPTEAPLVALAVTQHLSGPRTPAEIEAYIRLKWAGTGQADRAVRIARCESGLQANPPHNNPHYGVFQMGVREFRNLHNPGETNIFNARHNINAAHNYWKLSGWRPWSCRG